MRRSVRSLGVSARMEMAAGKGKRQRREMLACQGTVQARVKPLSLSTRPARLMVATVPVLHSQQLWQLWAPLPQLLPARPPRHLLFPPFRVLTGLPAVHARLMDARTRPQRVHVPLGRAPALLPQAQHWHPAQPPWHPPQPPASSLLHRLARTRRARHQRPPVRQPPASAQVRQLHAKTVMKRSLAHSCPTLRWL